MPHLRVLLLSRYSRLGASSRIRYYQFLPHLTAAGIDVDVAPFLDDAFLRDRYRGGISLKKTAAAYAHRLVTLACKRRHDLYWIESEALPWLPAWTERLLLRTNVPVVPGYDDAVFHNYDLHRFGVVRGLLGKKIDRVMARSAFVLAGNSYLAERARAAGARRVEIMPSVVDLDRYQIPSSCLEAFDAVENGSAARGAGAARETAFTIGWIGSPSTARYLELIKPALADACRKTGARIVLVGAGDAAASRLGELPLESRIWSESGEVGEISSFDVGIMPLEDDSWSRGKCGYKLIQYMACGLPVIASPVGVNRQIVEHGRNGLLASSQADWVDAIMSLSNDSGLRSAMGRNGRRKVESQYSLQSMAPRLAKLFLEMTV